MRYHVVDNMGLCNRNPFRPKPGVSDKTNPSNRDFFRINLGVLFV